MAADKLNLSDMFEGRFPSTDERLQKAYQDAEVQNRFGEIMHASTEERPTLEAQLTTYIAAAHILFPEETQIIYESLKKGT